jgi:hypothetical protein
MLFSEITIFATLRKHPVISFFLLLAFVMLQAHNLVPHFHNDHYVTADRHTHKHDHHHEKPQHHNEHDEDDTSNEESNEPFQTASHSADFGKTVIRPEQNIGDGFNSQLLIVEPILDYLFCAESSPPDLFIVQNEFPPNFYSYPLLFLRGPPYFLAKDC